MSSRSDLGALLAFFFVDLGAILAAAILYCVDGILGIVMGDHRSKPRVIEEEEEARCALRRGTFAGVMRKLVSRLGIEPRTRRLRARADGRIRLIS